MADANEGMEQNEIIESNDNRPVSRRGIKDGPSQNETTTSEGMAMQTGRPKSGKFMGRPPSSQSLTKRGTTRLPTGGIQSLRGDSAMMAIPNINMLDRPITQQGVTGFRTGTSRGPQFRQVLDKRYYEGIIRMKTKDILTEIMRLNGETESETQQQATSQVYEKRVREIAKELTKLQGELADYNLVIDKVNTSTNKSEIDAEAEELKHENERSARDLDELFGQNRVKEEIIRKLETELQDEKNITLKIIEEMNESDRRKYEELKAVSDSLQKEMNLCQQELELLTNQKIEYEDRISGSQIKQETVRLYHKLKERETRKAALLEEERTRSSPAQERDELLQKVKEDNADMAVIDRQINQIGDLIKKRKDELEMIEKDLEDCQTDRHQKFKELRKREETMEQFLSTFEESRKAETDKIDELERKIVIALQQMSKNLTRGTKLPSPDEFYLMKENLTVKQEELEKSKMTVEELNKKREQLSANLKKFDELEKRIQDEISTIQMKMVTMSDELKTFSNLEDLKSNATKRREGLMREREELKSKENSLKKVKTDLQRENEKLMKNLNENETYVQLNNLEKKLQLLEQNNNSMKEFIESKKSQTEYESIKANALKLAKEYNELLIAGQSRGA